MTVNSRRAGGGNLVKGYVKLPKDRAVYQPWSNTFALTIQIDDMQAVQQLDTGFSSRPA